MSTKMLRKAVPALRRRSRRMKLKRRKHKPRLSILATGGMAAGLIGGTTVSLSGKTPMAQAVYNGIKGTWGWDVVGKDVVREMVGYDSSDRTWSLPSFPVLLIGGSVIGGLASKIGNKFVKPSTFDAIPFIGKRIKL